MSRLGDVTFHLGVFDGPLDLLLQLIERRELDITTVSLARVADVYLSHVRSLQTVDPYGLAEFIAVAAKLLLIKSTVLLPRPERIAGEELADPTDLTERLREYQLIKQAATVLKEREESGMRSYGALAPLQPPPPRAKRESGTPGDLLRALQRLVHEIGRRPKEETVEREPFSVTDRIDLLRRICGSGERISLLQLLARAGRGEAVATFLALLELLRLGEVDVIQDSLFGDVAIVAAQGGVGVGAPSM